MNVKQKKQNLILKDINQLLNEKEVGIIYKNIYYFIDIENDYNLIRMKI